jgi:chitin disaccharide deacetylase
MRAAPKPVKDLESERNQAVRVNPLLNKLGLPADARAVILHADDIGMCQASVSAFGKLAEFGLVTCGSLMTTCSWFPAAAAFCRANPAVDIGVHLTLTSEWEQYRWGPLSAPDQDSGLVDPLGYFHRRVEEVQGTADLGAIQAELAAQIQRAQGAGLRLSHLDTHMFALSHPRLVPIYLRAALQNRLVAMLVRLEESGYRALGLDAETAAFSASTASRLEAEGLPLLDGLFFLPAGKVENRVEQVKQVLERIPAGVSHFFIHPSEDTPELRAILPDWQSRVADFHAFQDEGLRDWITKQGLVLVRYRDIQSALA